MADFTVNLAGPQGAGAQMVAPVQEQVIPDNTTPLLSGIVDIFAKGLVESRKSAALERKNAVVGEYVKNEGVYSDALVTGQWNASQVGGASRANFQKMMASYPEYATELLEARRGVYDGTETGEAQKKVDAEIAFRLKEKERASAAGYTFFTGMSADTEAKTIAASQATVRINNEFDAIQKRNAEQRAQASEGRAVASHVIQMQDYQDKQNSIKGLLEIADRNFDSLSGMGKDLLADPSKSPEQRQTIFEENIQRIKTGMLAVSAKNPEMAAPWQKLTDDMSATFAKLADPKNRAESEMAVLRAQWESQQYKAKLLVTSDPKVQGAVTIASLFPNNPNLIALGATPVVTGLLSDYGLGPKSTNKVKDPVIGTNNEKAALKTVRNALVTLQSGKANGDPVQNKTEAVNTVNELMDQTGRIDPSIPPDRLKDLSAFYASPEFGKLSAEGEIDMRSMQNAKKVFQVAYDPAVKEAIASKLDAVITQSPGRDQGGRGKPERKMIETMDIKFSGAGVVFEKKPGFSDTWSSNDTRKGLDDAAAGLNTLIKIGAHMEGSTDYAKFWEENKYRLLPTVFADPAKLKPGDVVQGRKYIGGAYNDRNNWVPVK